jgi:hypothetical protein
MRHTKTCPNWMIGDSIRNFNFLQRFKQIPIFGANFEFNFLLFTLHHLDTVRINPGKSHTTTQEWATVHDPCLGGQRPPPIHAMTTNYATGLMM